MYQSHKGWTSNDWPELDGFGQCEVSIPQGVDVKPAADPTTPILLTSINPTRGGRQTRTIPRDCLSDHVYQSHKGWTSNKTHQARDRSSWKTYQTKRLYLTLVSYIKFLVITWGSDKVRFLHPLFHRKCLWESLFLPYYFPISMLHPLFQREFLWDTTSISFRISIISVASSVSSQVPLRPGRHTSYAIHVSDVAASVSSQVPLKPGLSFFI